MIFVEYSEFSVINTLSRVETLRYSQKNTYFQEMRILSAWKAWGRVLFLTLGGECVAFESKIEKEYRVVSQLSISKTNRVSSLRIFRQIYLFQDCPLWGNKTWHIEVGRVWREYKKTSETLELSWSIWTNDVCI